MSDPTDNEKPPNLRGSGNLPAEPQPNVVPTHLKPAKEEKIDMASIHEMSVEEVDAFLEQEDPEFLKSVKEIGKDKSLTLEQIIIDDAAAALHAEIDLWNGYTGPLKWLYLAMPFAPRVTLKIKTWKYRAGLWMRTRWMRARNFIQFLATDGRKAAITYAKDKGKSVLAVGTSNLSAFRKLSLKVKSIFFTAIFFFAITLGVVLQIYRKGSLIPAEQEMFLTGFSNHADESFEYDQVNQVEPYINNARMAQNLYLTPRIFVNLKATKDPDSNPMGAFEFFIEGMSGDVVLELKDHEAKVKETVMDVIREMTFEELETENGKKELCTRLAKAVGRILSTGRVKNVRIQSVVIKP